MESQYRESNGETPLSKGRNDVAVSKRSGGIRCLDSSVILRLLALALTLTAAVMVGVDKQNTTVSVTLVPSLPPLNVPVVAKWQYMSAFVYFFVANTIACSYAAISLLLTLVNKNRNRSLSLVIIITDLLMVPLLFSGVGAALAVGLIGYQGNSHVQWKKVCNVFDTFCRQVAIATIISIVGSIAYVLLVIFAAFKLHKKM